MWSSVRPSGAPGQAQPTFPITILGTNGKALEAADAGFALTERPLRGLLTIAVGNNGGE